MLSIFGANVCTMEMVLINELLENGENLRFFLPESFCAARELERYSA